MKYILILLVNAEGLTLPRGNVTPAVSVSMVQFETEEACRDAVTRWMPSLIESIGLKNRAAWRAECLPAGKPQS